MPSRSKVPLFLLIVWATNAFAAIPDWFKTASQQTTPTHTAETSAALLFEEIRTSVEGDGEVHTQVRRVYKILRPNAVADFSKVSVTFGEETRLTYLKAWAISSRGLEYEVKEKEAVESEFSDSDWHVKEVDIPGTDVGAIVGYEYQQRGQPQFREGIWYLQREVPIGTSRYVLKLPSGWSYESWFDNHEAITPKQNGTEYTWEVAGVPEITIEPAMPAWNAIAGRMLLHYFPDNNRQKLSWPAEGAWYSTVISDRRADTPEIQKEVNTITAGKTSEVERIAALARWVQRNIRYVSISIGVGSYQPHTAAETLRNRYGDCKDKVTLLSTMLKDIGVESDYVLVHSERGVVRSEAPTATSFDHVILAIRLPKTISIDSLQARYEHPKYGKLLLFDPTSEWTPFGALPPSLQQSKGLLVADGTGELIDVPLLAPAASSLDRHGKFDLDGTGVLKGRVQEQSTGAMGAWYRSAFKQLNRDDRRKFMEIVLGGNISGYELTTSSIGSLDDLSKPFELMYAFEATHYAKKAGNLLLVRPRVVGIKRSVEFASEKRSYPVQFDGTTLQTDEFEITIPSEYEVDELPARVDISYDFGEYHSQFEQGNQTLKYSRQFTIKQVIVPKDRLDDLKNFYRQIATDEKSTAILKPKATAGK